MGRIKGFRRELITFCTLSAAIFLFLSLISYRAHDPSWFCTHSITVPIHNWCGAIGANAAALLIYMLGSAAGLVPVLLACIGLGLRDRIASLCVLMVLASTWCARYELDLSSDVPGGMLGSVFARLAVQWFNPIGTFLVLHGLLLVTFLVLFRISFVRAVRWIYSRRKMPIRMLVQARQLITHAATALAMLMKGTEIKETDIFAFESGQSSITPATELPTPMAATHESPNEVTTEAHAAPQGYILPDESLFDVPEAAAEDKRALAFTEPFPQFVQDRLLPYMSMILPSIPS